MTDLSISSLQHEFVFQKNISSISPAHPSYCISAAVILCVLQASKDIMKSFVSFALKSTLANFSKQHAVSIHVSSFVLNSSFVFSVWPFLGSGLNSESLKSQISEFEDPLLPLCVPTIPFFHSL